MLPIKRGGPANSYSSGRRQDLGGRYFRSAWEANIARYLNWCVKIGAVLKWEYEADEFEFPVKRGCRFYKTDFKIWFAKTPDVPEYWEVKGFMDGKSKTRLARMRRYYPNVKLVVIGRKEYASIRAQGRGLPNWE